MGILEHFTAASPFEEVEVCAQVGLFHMLLV
jgi:hypothetical protein